MTKNSSVSHPHSFEGLLEKAQSGDQHATGLLLQNHRDYLLRVVNQELDQNLRRKTGSSDIVQETLLTAHQNFDQFHGNDKRELLAWLRQIVLNDLHHERRKFKGTQKRQVDRERSLNFMSSLVRPLVDAQITPQTNAMLAEESARLGNAMSKLPDEYQQVLQLRSWQELEFEEIGTIMDRSSEAARKLWTRAVLKLEQVLKKS